LDRFWPFGQSILENIFKVYKQKELLEDAILIYRISRAPERRVFKIDVGNMPSHLAMSYVERIKNEIHQRRIPSTHGGQSILDATYNPMCLDLNTRIPLLDGRTLALHEIIQEFEQGKQNWAYSCDPETGKIVPGLINWAGITRRNTEAIKVTLDNGETFISTPDHKIPVFGRGFVEAQHLTTEDSLIAFETRRKSISGGRTNDYEQVYDHESNSWQWTHRVVADFFRKLNKHQEFTYLDENIGREKSVVHHRDYNRFNNHPVNLTFMNREDHILYHAATKREFWENMTNEYRDTMIQKISQTLKDNWEGMTDLERQSALYKIRKAQSIAVYMRKNDPEVAERYRKNMGAAQQRAMQNNPALLEQRRKNVSKRVKFNNQKLTLTFDMLQIVADKVKSGIKNKREIMRVCSEDQRMLELIQQHNSDKTDCATQNKINLTEFGEKKLNRLLAQFGYKNWKHFVRDIDQFNHRIVKIERVENRDTGTITIDGLEQYHNYHTFAIDAGIFVKNSINEDYFFPVTAEGRGSSVDMLQGGANLGEIDDLKYFNNRLARGLRVPSSYLPTGPDDSQLPLNDGKVGTAMIQEFRFNQYCERLQDTICANLDQEFKLFLRWRGFNIDSGLFDLAFNPPQNFAAYRQIELDNARVSVYTSLEQIPYFSKRFLIERFLGLTEEEMAKNEKLWREERNKNIDVDPEGNDLRSVGISPGDLQTDNQTGEEAEQAEQMSPEGGLPPAGPVAPPDMGVSSAGTGAPPGL
jgi:hypothetical protein